MSPHTHTILPISHCIYLMCDSKYCVNLTIDIRQISVHWQQLPCNHVFIIFGLSLHLKYQQKKKTHTKKIAINAYHSTADQFTQFVYSVHYLYSYRTVFAVIFFQTKFDCLSQFREPSEHFLTVIITSLSILFY